MRTPNVSPTGVWDIFEPTVAKDEQKYYSLSLVNLNARGENKRTLLKWQIKETKRKLQRVETQRI